MSEIDATLVKDGQLAVATVPQTGTLVGAASEIDATALVETADGLQLCVKTCEVGGGGGGGGGTVDQTYDPTSTNAQSGTAVAEAVAPYLKNTATALNALTILGSSSSNGSSINIGKESYVNKNSAMALGTYAKSTGLWALAVGIGTSTNDSNRTMASGIASIAIGKTSQATAENAIQLGEGTNSTANSFQVFDYQMLDGTTGKIPAERLPDMAGPLSGATAPTSGTEADMAGQTYVNTTDGSLYVCQALTGGDPTTYYTVVGSPTINSSYVASNFGSSSYVDTGVTFRPSGAWHIKMKFNFGMTSSTWYKLTGNTGNAVSIGIDNNKIKLECSTTGSGWDACTFTCSTVIQAGRDYWIDFGFDGTNLYYVDLSTDGVTYTRDGSATSTKKVYSSGTMGLGCAFSGYTSHYFVGSIYLTDFEIYEATELTYRAVSLGGPLWKSATESIKTITGYDGAKTQVLKNVNGTLTWVDE